MTRMEGKENQYRVLRFTTWRKCSQLHCILVHQLAIARFEIEVEENVVCFCTTGRLAHGFGLNSTKQGDQDVGVLIHNPVNSVCKIIDQNANGKHVRK